MPPPPPIDPLTGPKFALAGRVVTMDGQSRVLPAGVVCVDHGGIVAVRAATDPLPPGFEGVKPLATGGTIYPGLIELHNHLSYNALRLWRVPKRYTNRNQWGGTPEYRRLISGPMKVLGQSPGLLPALVRYVECKCLLGGVTTSQGVELYSNKGARRFYRGIVRNVEQTDEAEMPEAGTKIADVDASDAKKFKARLLKSRCFLLHLSEGTDKAARDHFRALQMSPTEWAITEALAGIHSAALEPADFAVLAQRQASMVWSPLSNLLLYGATADVKAAKDSGVRIGIGSDWSPSGSKNLLGELKVAHLYAQEHGIFTPREIVAMATRDAAGILGWGAVLGSIEAGKRADLLVIDGTADDAYLGLVRAKETDIRLVVINGVARYGKPASMKALGSAGETLKIHGKARTVFLEQETADPVVGTLTLAKARSTLADALAHLPDLARALEPGAPGPPSARPSAAGAAGSGLTWYLALDELEQTGMELRPRIPLRGRRGAPTGPPLPTTVATVPLSEIVVPLTLDPLTVVDDVQFLDAVDAQMNLPPFLAPALRALYG